MKTNYIAFFAVMFFLSVIYSCESQDEMGHSILPEDDYATVVLTDTIEVKAYTEYDDNVTASYTSYLTSGGFSDPIFGKTITAFAAKFSNTSYGKFGEDAVTDSVVLTLGLDTTSQRFYGDSLKNFSMEVFPLIMPLSADSVYYQDIDFEGYYDKTKVGEVQFSPSTIKNTLTIHLDKSYGDKIIESVSDTTFDEKICGLYFKTPDDDLGTITRFYYNSRYSDFSYTVYYHCPEDTASSSVVFSVSDTDMRLNLARHDYSGTVLENLSENRELDYAYIQGLSGTKVRLEFPDIQKFNSVGGKYFSLVRAQLIVPLADSIKTLQSLYPAMERLYCSGKSAITGSEFTFYELFDFSSNGTRSTQYHVFNLDYETNCYTIDFTGRMQNLLDIYASGNTPAYSIYLHPTNQVSDFSRSVINTQNNKENPLRLVVEYLKYEK